VTMDILTRWCANMPAVRLVRIGDAIKMKTEREMSLSALGR